MMGDTDDVFVPDARPFPHRTISFQNYRRLTHKLMAGRESPDWDDEKENELIAELDHWWCGMSDKEQEETAAYLKDENAGLERRGP